MNIDFEVLFEEHYDAIARYLRKRFGDAALADDLAQSTFLEAYRSRASYDPEKGSPRGWLFGIATNLANRQHRTEGRRLRAYARAAMRDVPPQDEYEALRDAIDRRGRHGKLAAALAALPRTEYVVVALHYWGGLSTGEIAQALEIPRATVKTRLHRAHKRIRAQLELRTTESNDG